MLTKIYLGTLATAAGVLGILYTYAYSWLSSIGDPVAAFDAFKYYLGLSWSVLWLMSAVLLTIANIAFWRSRSAWTMWATFGFFTFFILLRYFWLEHAANGFRSSKLDQDGGFNLSVFLGVVLIFLFAAIVFFNQYVSLRLFDRLYPPPPEDSASEAAD